MAKIKDSVKSSFWEKVNNFVTNIATLDVVTLTGTIKVDLSTPSADEANKDSTSWKKLLDSAKVISLNEAGKPANSVEAVAISHFEFDQDAVLFVQKGAETNHEALLKLHENTVKQAQETRQAFVNKIIDIF